jgi:hypothetical protein
MIRTETATLDPAALEIEARRARAAALRSFARHTAAVLARWLRRRPAAAG